MQLLLMIPQDQLLYNPLGVKYQEEVESEDQRQPDAEDSEDISPEHVILSLALLLPGGRGECHCPGRLRITMS